MKYTVIALACLGLTACAEVVTETPGTFTYLGTEYKSVTRTFASGNGTLDERIIFNGPDRISCSATDDQDCIAVLRDAWIDGTGQFR